MDVVDFEIEHESLHGDAGGFLRVRRLHLRNRRVDGSRSAAYVCDFLDRPKGIDAVVVAIFRREHDGVRVLLRDGLRPALALGRPASSLPIPDPTTDVRSCEVVAGIIERHDRGETGVRQRAAIEVAEEAGYVVDPDDFVFLGAGTFPSPGSMPEKFWLVGAEIDETTVHHPPRGDGSPMEEGARIRWLDLGEAIDACVEGRIADAKTEIVLRRLADRISGGRQPANASIRRSSR